MADHTLISHSRKERAHGHKTTALGARRTWATRVLAVGALLVLLLALGFAFLEQGLDTRFGIPQATAATAADHVPTTTPTREPTVAPTAAVASPSAATAAKSHTPITRVREKDGAVMVYLPAGEFWMGSDEADPQARSFESPRHKVRVGSFWIDRTEVTNAQYRQCVDAGACGPPQRASSASRVRYYDRPEYDDYPVVNVTWQQARLYAAWAGGRLPTEAEWEYAARGPGGSTYPWGEGAPNEGLLNYNLALHDTTPVGSYPEGASWCGALDLSGNAWEWTSSLFQPYPYDVADGREDPEAKARRVLRGGAFVGDARHVRCATRAFPAPGYWDGLCGFRVVLASSK